MWHGPNMSFVGKLQYRRYLCFICGLYLTLPLLAIGPVLAGQSFPKVSLQYTIVAKPPGAIEAFRARATEYQKVGAFEVEGGSTQAKAWFLSHISPDFICERDFGGGCKRDSYIARINSFLFKSGRGGLYGEGVKPKDPDSLLSRGLHTVAIDIAAMMGPLEKGEGSAGDYCRADLEPLSWNALGEASKTAMADVTTDIGDELMAAEHLKGVLGTWNIRLAPDIKSKVVGQLHNEVVLMVTRGYVIPVNKDDPLQWYHVRHHSGVEGFIAADEAHLLHQLDARLCLGLDKEGDVAITRYIGGGD